MSRSKPPVAAALVLLLLVLAGCTSRASPGSNLVVPSSNSGAGSINATTNDEYTGELGSLRGSVRDEEQKPIVNATVLLSAFKVEVLTTGNGSFQFRNVPVGKQIVEAHASGHKSASKATQVVVDAPASVDFVLPVLPVQIPHYLVQQKVSKIHQGGGYFGNQCDGCNFVVEFPVDPDFVLVEVEGKHANSNPGDADGISWSIRKVTGTGASRQNGSYLSQCSLTAGSDYANYKANYDKCSQLPVHQVFDVAKLNNTAPGGHNARGVAVQLTCDATWYCLEESYTTYVTAFYYWTPDPIPQGYTGGEGLLCAQASANGQCLKDSPSAPGQGPRTSSEGYDVPRGQAMVIHMVHVPAPAAKDNHWLLWTLALVAAAFVVVLYRRSRDSLASILAQAKAAFARGDDKTARRLALQVLEKDAKNADAWFLYGAVLVKKGQHERAIEELESAMKDLGPQVSGLAYVLSLAYQRNGQPESARKWLPMVARDRELWNSLLKETDHEVVFGRAKPTERRKEAAVDPSYA
jgi:tetratricopeptide (TPR) repeat protein